MEKDIKFQFDQFNKPKMKTATARNTSDILNDATVKIRNEGKRFFCGRWLFLDLPKLVSQKFGFALNFLTNLDLRFLGLKIAMSVAGGTLSCVSVIWGFVYADFSSSSNSCCELNRSKSLPIRVCPTVTVISHKVAY